MDSYQGFAISLSGLSLLVSIWNYRKTLALNRQVQLLNERKIVAEHYSCYVNLIHSEFLTLRDHLSNISSLCARTNSDIGHILDMYNTRSHTSVHTSVYVRRLQHLFVDLHEGICEALRHELPWQTVEHLYSHRLSYISHLDPDSELLHANSRRRWALFVVPRIKAAYPELRFLESEPGRSTGLDHGVGHFRPLSITRQRHLLA